MSKKMLRPDAYHTLEALNLNLLDEIWLDNITGMPTIKACDRIPNRLVPFNKARLKMNTECGVHLYIEDHYFNNIWTQPERYISILKRFDCVISPDFSTYLDMPTPMVYWQIYRRRLITQWLQRADINVIYNVQTMKQEFDEYQLLGVEPHGVIAINPPLDFYRNIEGRNEFYRQIQIINERLSPKLVIIYGKSVSLPTSINFKFYNNDNIRVRRTLAERKRGILAKSIKA